MIESNIIKRYIIKTFMQNSRMDIGEIADKVVSSLKSKFLLNETVIVNENQLCGKVVRCQKDCYKVLINEKGELDFKTDEISRRVQVNFDDVIMFLECATKKTPFGRILIENVFEKLSDPTFGFVKTFREEIKRPERTAAQKSAVQRQIKEFSPVVTEHPEDPKVVKKIPVKLKYPTINLEELPKFQIDKYSEANLKDLIQIFIFFSNFNKEMNTSISVLQDLGNDFLSPEFSSPSIFFMAKALIEMFENEVAIKGEKFYETISFVISKLPPFTSDLIATEQKKRVPMTEENWKAQTRTFIQNLSAKFEDPKIQQFTGMFKQQAIDLRLKFFVFLIDCTVLTEAFKEIVSKRHEDLKSDKAASNVKGSDRENTAAVDIISNTREYESRIVNHPLKVHIGTYKGHMIFLMSGNIMMRVGSDFYLLNKENAFMVLRDLDSQTKLGKASAVNLKAAIEVCFRSQ